MLSISGLDVAYGQSQVLWGVDLEVRAGELVCLMGRNGVGKTTLLKTTIRALAGARRPPDVRRIRHHDVVAPTGGRGPVSATCRKGARSSRISRSRRISGWRCSAAAALPRSTSPLALFPALKPLLARKGGVLSGGEQHDARDRRALLTKPKLLMLDEPTEGIQPLDHPRDRRGAPAHQGRAQAAVLLVEQYLDFAERLADK